MSAAAAIEPARRAWAYLRISKDDAGDELGIERQRSALTSLVTQRGWDLAGVFADNDISASKGKHRPGYQSLLATVRPGDVIVCTEMSRLTRHPREFEDLVDLVERQHVEIVASRAGHVDLQTSGGRAFARTLGAFARMEVEQMAERVKAKHVQNARTGRAAGGSRPYGYRRVGPGQLEVNEEEAEVVRWMAEQVLNGVPTNAIVRSLNERDVLSSTGKPWRPLSVTTLLLSPRNAGQRSLNGAVMGPGEWPAILDPAVFERVQAKLSHAPRGRRPRRNVLSGFIRCASERDGQPCGYPMLGHTSGRPSKGADDEKVRYAVYTCSSPPGRRCAGNTAVAARVEDYVVDALLGDLSHVNLAKARAQLEHVESARLIDQIEADTKALDRLADMMSAGKLAMGEWERTRGPIFDRLQESRAALARIDTPTLDVEYVDEQVWASLTFDQRREVIALRIDHVEISKGKPGKVFDDSRVKIFWKS